MTGSTLSTGKNGFVLVIVLWFIALLTLMTAAFSVSARGSIRLVEAEITSVMERAILDGGVELAAIGLALKDEAEQWHADGRIYRKTFDKADLSIRMYDQSGRIDINKSDPELLIGLLKQVTIDQGQAEKIAERILAGRNDMTVRADKKPLGDVVEQRSRSRNMSEPKFMDVSQLQYVAGITREIYRKIRPFVTVHSDVGRINPLTAPREVLLAIPRMTEIDVDAILEIRRAGHTNQALTERLPPEASKWTTESVGQAIEVVVGIRSDSDYPSQFMSAVIMPMVDKDAPYRILRRRIMSIAPELREGAY